MSKDPWQRANDLARLREFDARQSPPPRQSASLGPLVAVLILLIVVLGGAAVWYWRAQIVEVSKPAPIPAPVKEAVHKLDEHPADVNALFNGLGISLSIMGDYKDVITATRDWGIEWKLSSMGGGHLRLTAPGLEIACANEQIQNYTVDIPAVFAEPKWSAWAEELKAAGYFPGQRYKDVIMAESQSGDEAWLHRKAEVRGQHGAHAAYRLRFKDGELVELLGAVEFGEPAGQTYDVFVPSDDAMAAERMRVEDNAGDAEQK